MARKGKIKIAIEPIEEEIRPVRSRKYVYFVLIVCEDENTEPAYFKQFEDLFEDLLPEETVYVKRVGTGRNSLGVVNAAIAERTRIYEENNHREIDETWVVFDKDDLDQTPGNRHNFESALTLSKERDIQVAYSNECFELWLLLHFNDVQLLRVTNLNCFHCLFVYLFVCSVSIHDNHEEAGQRKHERHVHGRHAPDGALVNH